MLYSKQLLHSDELPFFKCGNEQIILSVEGIKVAPAICYESLQYKHIRKVSKFGADIYLASVAKSQRGIEKAFKHYPKVAQDFSMHVLMANSIGYCDNFESAGQSSIWNDKGNLLVSMNETDEGLLIFDTKNQGIWKVLFT